MMIANKHEGEKCKFKVKNYKNNVFLIFNCLSCRYSTAILWMDVCRFLWGNTPQEHEVKNYKNSVFLNFN